MIRRRIGRAAPRPSALGWRAAFRPSVLDWRAAPTKKPPAELARWFSLQATMDLLPGLSGPARRPHRTGPKGWP